MSKQELETVAQSMVAKGKGILAADESMGTIKRRFDSIKIESNDNNRRAYRDMLFTTKGIEEAISGVILFDETIRTAAMDGTPFPQLLSKKGIMPGIKVDKGPVDIPGFPGEIVTEGLDGLRARVKEYKEFGAKFAKWRAVITIGDGIPTYTCFEANAHALARYAALCQEGGIVPIVEPEVLLDGSHTIERCQEVTEQTLKVTFTALFLQRVHLEGMILKPSMVVSGKDNPRQAGVDEVARAHDPVLETNRSRSRAGHRVSLRRAKRRKRDGASQRDECHGSPSMAGELLLRARLAGSGTQSVERRGGQCRRRRRKFSITAPNEQRGAQRQYNKQMEAAA